jgi:hypothetical protein
MRVLALAFTLLLAQFALASAQTATPDSENGRYSFYPVADGVLSTPPIVQHDWDVAQSWSGTRQ